MKFNISKQQMNSKPFLCGCSFICGLLFGNFIHSFIINAVIGALLWQFILIAQEKVTKNGILSFLPKELNCLLKERSLFDLIELLYMGRKKLTWNALLPFISTSKESRRNCIENLPDQHVKAVILKPLVDQFPVSVSRLLKGDDCIANESLSPNGNFNFFECQTNHSLIPTSLVAKDYGKDIITHQRLYQLPAILTTSIQSRSKDNYNVHVHGYEANEVGTTTSTARGEMISLSNQIMEGTLLNNASEETKPVIELKSVQNVGILFLVLITSNWARNKGRETGRKLLFEALVAFTVSVWLKKKRCSSSAKSQLAI
eukprot:TRINITY_DN773145_c0_g1_i1.p1 TRINITY_DN773145_c0_g1~~TRINITY_DN773145_c0_g1_i1.p1  ORF type:complete len:315 (-),score=50.83 TRINITY_DN773145_c0_g1_i1:213-1157(-)